jgi:hypothetical protein
MKMIFQYECTDTIFTFLIDLTQKKIFVDKVLKNGAASARTSDPGANIGRVLGHTIRMKGVYQPSIVARRSKCCEQLL